jgi:hypothetical protein
MEELAIRKEVNFLNFSKTLRTKVLYQCTSFFLSLKPPPPPPPQGKWLNTRFNNLPALVADFNNHTTMVKNPLFFL